MRLIGVERKLFIVINQTKKNVLFVSRIAYNKLKENVVLVANNTSALKISVTGGTLST